MKNKILSLLLAAALLFSAFLTASAAGSQQFSDVSPESWFYESVNSICSSGLMNGTGENTFSPQDSCTRGMVVTILYRLESEPECSAEATFSDVPDGEWYSHAVVWAASNNIVSGYIDRTFRPDNLITREQMAAILFRYAGFKGYNTGEQAELSRFSDYAAISSYAQEALSWANAVKLINGVSENMLSPEGNADRAQVAAIITRFIEHTSAGQAVEDYNSLSENPSKTGEANVSAYYAGTGDAGSDSGKNDKISGTDETKDYYEFGIESDKLSDFTKNNIFMLKASDSPDGRTVTVTVLLTGKVKLCGFDLKLHYNPDILKINSVNTDFDLSVEENHYTEGVISFNYANAKNITKEKKVMTVNFDIVDNQEAEGLIWLSPVDVIQIEDGGIDPVDAQYLLTRIKHGGIR